MGYSPYSAFLRLLKENTRPTPRPARSQLARVKAGCRPVKVTRRDAWVSGVAALTGTVPRTDGGGGAGSVAATIRAFVAASRTTSRSRSPRREAHFSMVVAGRSDTVSVGVRSEARASESDTSTLSLAVSVNHSSHAKPEYDAK